MLEKLSVCMFHKMSIGASCHLLPRFNKLTKFSIRELRIWRQFMVRNLCKVQLCCKNHSSCAEGELSFRFWNDIGRFQINFRRKHQFQHSCVFHFSSNLVPLKDPFAKVSPQQMVLPDHTIEMVLIQRKYCL